MAKTRIIYWATNCLRSYISFEDHLRSSEGQHTSFLQISYCHADGSVGILKMLYSAPFLKKPSPHEDYLPLAELEIELSAQQKGLVR